LRQRDFDRKNYLIDQMDGACVAAMVTISWFVADIGTTTERAEIAAAERMVIATIMAMSELILLVSVLNH
jgi:hypothetical protein